MKAFFDFGRIPGWRLKTIIVLLAGLAATATGCGKTNTSGPAAAPSQNTVAATPPTPTPGPTAQAAPAQPVATTTSNDSLQSLQLLNRALVRWMIKNRRHPQSFEEFASSANIQIPDPPAGKKYALNARGFIVLVGNQ